MFTVTCNQHCCTTLNVFLFTVTCNQHCCTTLNVFLFTVTCNSKTQKKYIVGGFFGKIFRRTPHNVTLYVHFLPCFFSLLSTKIRKIWSGKEGRFLARMTAYQHHRSNCIPEFPVVNFFLASGFTNLYVQITPSVSLQYIGYDIYYKIYFVLLR